MTQLQSVQKCPYCGTEVEENHSEWEEGDHQVTCDRCDKEYSVTPKYDFLGWVNEQICKECREVESECYCDETDDQP